jgi:hypothetical protein
MRLGKDLASQGPDGGSPMPQYSQPSVTKTSIPAAVKSNASKANTSATRNAISRSDQPIAPGVAVSVWSA